MTQRYARLQISVYDEDLTTTYSGYPNRHYDLTYDMPWQRDLPVVGDYVSMVQPAYPFRAHSPVRVVGRYWNMDGTPSILLQDIVLFENPERRHEDRERYGDDRTDTWCRILMKEGDAHPLVEIMAAGWVLRDA